MAIIKDFELKLLSSISDLRRWQELQKNGITPAAFYPFRHVSDFVWDYYKRFHSLPSVDLLQTTFDDFRHNPVADDEEFRFMIDKVRTESIRRRATKILENGIKILEENPVMAVEFLSGKLSTLSKLPQFSSSVVDKSARDRLERYQENRKLSKSQGIIGIKTGLSFFDDKYIGWLPGSLIGIMGRLGVGKSNLLIYISGVGWLDRKRVLFLSPEMPREEIEARFDTIVGKLKGYEFSNESLLWGGKIKVDEYEKYLDEISKRSDFILCDTFEGKPFTLSAIESLIDEHKPDLVAIDGFPLLVDEHGSGEMWQSVKTLAYGLKTLAICKNIVIMVTTQANREAVNKKGLNPELHNVSYGDALAQAVDVMISIADPEDHDDPNIRWLTVPKNRKGKAVRERVKLRFNVDVGDIGI